MCLLVQQGSIAVITFAMHVKPRVPLVRGQPQLVSHVRQVLSCTSTTPGVSPNALACMRSVMMESPVRKLEKW